MREFPTSLRSVREKREMRVPAVARRDTHLHSFVTPIHEISGLEVAQKFVVSQPPQRLSVLAGLSQKNGGPPGNYGILKLSGS
jgi:hypothetical protein